MTPRPEPVTPLLSEVDPLPVTPVRVPSQPALPPEPGTESVLETAWRIVRRRWLIIVASIVLAGALAGGLSASSEKRFTASASLLVGTASDTVLRDPGTVDAERTAATNAGLLGLGVVAQDAARRLNSRVGASDISGAVSVVPRQDSDLIDVNAETPDPKLSADIANAYGSAYIEFRQRSARKQIEGALGLAEEGLAAMTPEQRAGPEGQALSKRINDLQTAKSLQTGGAEMVQRASAPSSPTSPQPKRDGILGAILGAILGFVLASLRERRDRAIRTVDDLEAATPWRVLARIPKSRLLAGDAQLASRGIEAEAFRMLRTNLRYFGVKSEIRSLIITSARPGDGKSMTAQRLAETMAIMGDRVVLVEADLHRTSASWTDVASDVVERGLSGFLIGRPLDDVLVDVMVGDPEDPRVLTVLPSGPMPPNPSELLESERMAELMFELEDRFDIVILDSPPLPTLSDASTLLGHVSGAIVVTALGSTTPEDIHHTATQMAFLGGDVLGMVANFAPSQERYYGSGRPTRHR
jgi:capsular exopolysaccharide synthesis family protein